MGLKVNNLSFAIEKKQILHPLSYDFFPGHIYGVIGRNGSGKSMLLKCLSGALPSLGERLWNGVRILHNELLQRRLCMLVHGDFFAAFPFSILDVVSWGRYGLCKDEAAIESALKRCSLFESRYAHIDTLSQGERQLVAIAQALASRCPLLFFDEASAHLDIYHRAFFRTLLQELKEQGHLILWAGHDLTELQKVCDAFLVLDKGLLVPQADHSILFAPL